MGHRALVAYERPDGRYDRHYAHWGATSFALRHRIAPETPFADDVGDRWTPAVEPVPEATELSIEDAVTFDYRQFEAFYVVSLAWVVAAYLPLWFGSTADGDGDIDTDVGALVAIRDDRDAAHVRRWFRATRAVVRDVVRRGAVDEREATDYLDARVAEWAGDYREVISTV
ncbi:DUF6735 family protein [Haladaptatus salinisoli]|uniref:DUF6735 family protein n=1 Tax=Haladaptatus salinisoli TaxID=2884876 RepID=UPI001D0A76B0|nr:DUF6735 family protein [Haladaptatus salinisoli]